MRTVLRAPPRRRRPRRRGGRGVVGSGNVRVERTREIGDAKVAGERVTAAGG